MYKCKDKNTSVSPKTALKMHFGDYVPVGLYMLCRDHTRQQIGAFCGKVKCEIKNLRVFS